MFLNIHSSCFALVPGRSFQHHYQQAHHPPQLLIFQPSYFRYYFLFPISAKRGGRARERRKFQLGLLSQVPPHTREIASGIFSRQLFPATHLPTHVYQILSPLSFPIFFPAFLGNREKRENGDIESAEKGKFFSSTFRIDYLNILYHTQVFCNHDLICKDYCRCRYQCASLQLGGSRRCGRCIVRNIYLKICQLYTVVSCHTCR